MTSTLSYIKTHTDRFLKELFDLIRIPSISASNAQDTSGITMDDPQNQKTSKKEPQKSKPQDLSRLSAEELQEAIKKAVKKEDYEMAVRLRDEISKRTKDK